MPQIDNLYLLGAAVELFAASIMAILLLGCWEYPSLGFSTIFFGSSKKR